MDAEMYKLTMGVVSDGIKILGPAIITAFVGYKAGKSQLLLKIEELNKNNEFKARETIFNFQKEKLTRLDQSVANLNESLSQLAGLRAGLGDEDDELAISLFINKYLAIYIEGAPFELANINDVLQKFPTEFSRERERLQNYIQRSEELKKPTTVKDVHTTVVELIDIYGFASHCVRLLMEKGALEVFRPYVSDA